MFKDIEGFEMYQISDTGEVYSKYSNKTLKPNNVYRIYRYGEFVEECVGYENTFKRLLMSSSGFTNMLKTGKQNRQGFSVTLV